MSTPADSDYYYPFIMLVMTILVIINFISMSLDSKDNETETQINQNDTSSIKSPNTIAHLISKEQLKSKNNLRMNYLICYLIVRASIWSKSPYMFILYYEFHGLTISEIGSLYVVDALSSMIFAPFIGVLADKYGRKLFSLLYNVSVIINLLLRLTGRKDMAYIAQVLTGLGSIIVNTSYESWVVCESDKIFKDKQIKQKFLKKLFKK